MKLLLASQSPRRRQLLGELGYPAEFVNIAVDEVVPEGMPADQVAEHLARLKASACDADRLGDGEVLVTADTVVVHGGRVLGKPADRTEALAMLHALAADRHAVYTGVCLRARDAERSFTERTDVVFAPLTDAELEHYVDTCRPYDKAGAYGIQDWIGMVGVSRIEGCYYNVVGLPLPRLFQELKEML